MKKKPAGSAKRTKRATRRKGHNVSDAMRAEDEKLREKLRTADLRKLDAALELAIHPTKAP